MTIFCDITKLHLHYSAQYSPNQVYLEKLSDRRPVYITGPTKNQEELK